MIIHTHPDEAVKALGSQLLDLKPKKQRLKIEGRDGYHYLTPYEMFIRKHVQQDLWFLIRIVLGWHFLDEDIIGKQLLSFYLQDGGREDKITLIPRGHGKTLTSVARMVQHPLIDQDCALINLSSTVDNSQQIGNMWSDIMTGNDMLLAAFPDILPTKDNKPSKWGNKGYSLPHRKPRRDPTLACLSLGSKMSGKRGDIVIIDDLIDEALNNSTGLKRCEDFYKMLLPICAPHGWFEVLATRYNDGDLYGKLINGELEGKQGAYKSLVMSCWENDDSKKAKPIYPQKCRWTAKTVSGFTAKQLQSEKRTMGAAFFNAQYRNDPAPDEDQTINYKDLTYYSKDELPELGEVVYVGVEITGGGRPIYQTLIEEAEAIECDIPLKEITNPRKIGESKHDRILSCLDPVINNGRLKVLEEHCPKKDPPDGTLGYEIRRFGVARHDDIVDALHNNIEHLAKNYFPDEGQPCPITISCDLAWNDKKESDWTVALALASLPDETYAVLDYIRFKEKSPRVIANRIISFYRKWEGGSSLSRGNGTSSLALSYS